MLKKVVLSFIGVGLLFAMTGREIMDKQKELQSTDSEETKEYMILINEDGSKEKREVSVKKKKNGDDLTNSLIVFVRPAEVQGTALLNIQQDGGVELQYVYMPAQKILQRIAQGAKKSYFMGTDFTYEDLSPDKLDNYNYKLIKEEKVKVTASDKNEDCYVVEAIPTDAYRPKTNYGKKLLWITKDKFYTKKVEFYDKKLNFIKSEVSWNFVNKGGTVYRPLKVFVNNKKENHKTLVQVSNIKINLPISNKIFTKRYLVNEEHMIDE